MLHEFLSGASTLTNRQILLRIHSACNTYCRARPARRSVGHDAPIDVLLSRVGVARISLEGRKSSGGCHVNLSRFGAAEGDAGG